MTTTEVQQKVIELIRDSLHSLGPNDAVEPAMKLLESSQDPNSLCADSLDITELVMGIEGEFSIEISDEEADQLFVHEVTVADVANYVARQTGVAS